MPLFYYTFGTSEQFPYQGGWVEVLAEDIWDAHRKFRQEYPDKSPGCLNCSDYYTESAFLRTGMAESGNRGAYRHRLF